MCIAWHTNLNYTNQMLKMLQSRAGQDQRSLQNTIPVFPCHILQSHFKLLKQGSSLKILFVMCWLN